MLKIAESSPHALSYDDAWLYCATCTEFSYYDWRLPTHNEYQSDQLRNIYGWTEDSDYRGKIRTFPVRSMKTIEGPVSIPLPYDEAWLYCATLTYDNKYNWRMPSSLEYNDLSIGKSWYIERLMAYLSNSNSGKLKVVPLRTI